MLDYCLVEQSSVLARLKETSVRCASEIGVEVFVNTLANSGNIYMKFAVGICYLRTTILEVLRQICDSRSLWNVAIS